MAYAPLLPLGVGGRQLVAAPQSTVSTQLTNGTPTWNRRVTPQSGSSRNGRNSPPGELDVVQFISQTFYAYEGQPTVCVRVISAGSLLGSSSVRWHTRQFSAMDGKKYVGVSPEHKKTLTFGPGECERSFEIQIINDENFDTALEFDIILSEGKNCVIDPRGSQSSVMIIDDDLFPANKFEDVIKASKDEEKPLYDVGFSLLFSFMKFCFVHVPEIWWKTILVLLLSNLGNMYYLATIFIKVYLIDTVLNTKDPRTLEHLWIPGDRHGTAILLGLAWVLPNIILLATDYFEMAVLEMGFNIRYHLRVNLFRKYLRYTKESRAKVPIQDLKISIMEDIPEVVSEGYLILFELWAMLGKIAMVMIFMIRETPGALQTLAIYPVLIVLYLQCTYSRRLELMAKEGDGQSATVKTLMHAHNSYKLISCYDKRTLVVRQFEEVLKDQRKFVMALKGFNFWNAQLIPWITLLACGLYIGSSAKLVLSGRISLGSVTTMINVYKDLGDRFETILSGMKSLSKAISPLSALTVQFNLDTDIPAYADIFEANQKFALSYGKNFDAIPIVFRSVSIDYSPSMHTGKGVLSAEAPQGSVVQIVGPHDSGKGVLLKQLCDIHPTQPGQVLHSPHLQVLQVPHEPLFLESGGVFSNLHLPMVGQKAFNQKIMQRGRRILRRLGLNKPWIMEEYLCEEGKSPEPEPEEKSAATPGSMLGCYEDEESEEEDEDGNPTWAQKMSGSEKWRFQLARAFFHDPHVLVVHRPVDELDVELQELILSLFREFVDKKGLEIDDDDLDIQQRRPRTVIFSAGNEVKTSIPDFVWRVGPKGVTVERGPRGNRAAWQLSPTGSHFSGPGSQVSAPGSQLSPWSRS